MSGPGPRGAIRAFEAALWLVVAYALTHLTGIDDQGVVLLAGLWLASCGLGEALVDARRAGP